MYIICETDMTIEIHFVRWFFYKKIIIPQNFNRFYFTLKRFIISSHDRLIFKQFFKVINVIQNLTFFNFERENAIEVMDYK